MRATRALLFNEIQIFQKHQEHIIFDAGVAEVLRNHHPPNRTYRSGKEWTFGDEWQHIIVDAIIRKYTDMRCNVNNNIRKMFKGKYSIIITMNIRHHYILHNIGLSFLNS